MSFFIFIFENENKKHVFKKKNKKSVSQNVSNPRCHPSPVTVKFLNLFLFIISKVNIRENIMSLYRALFKNL